MCWNSKYALIILFSTIVTYLSGRFYFEAFQPDNEINNQGNNFDLTVKDGDLFVSTVWSSTKGKIAVGDKVVKINGKPAKKYDFCESILNGIPELKEKKKTKLTIETASGVKDIIHIFAGAVKEKDYILIS